MLHRFCTNCNKQLSTQITECPCCGHTLPALTKQASVNLDHEHVTLYSMMAPAVENPDSLVRCHGQIKNHLQKYAEILSPKALDVLLDLLKTAFSEARDSWEAEKRTNNEAAKRMLASVNAALNSGSDYTGLGFSAITDAAGAVAYAALDAVQGHIHDVTQSVAAHRRALNAMQQYASSSDSSHIVGVVFKAIDRIVFEIGNMLQSKAFVDAHRDFYESVTDSTTLFGQNLPQLLRSAICRNDFIGRDFFLVKDLPLMEAAGYIHLIDSHTYYTTGKYETETLRARFRKEHPAETAAEKAAIAAANQNHCTQAEEALKRKQYFRAATRFAQAEGDRDALRRSLKIWNSHLSGMPQFNAGWAVGADGSYHQLFGKYMSVLLTPEQAEESIRFRQLLSCAWTHYVGLTMDGRILSSSDNIYSNTNIPRIEIGTKYLPSNGSNWPHATAISCSGSHLVALHRDGTVSAAGENKHGQCNVAGWKDVVQISANMNSTAALTAAGTVLLAGIVSDHAADCSQWANLQDIQLHNDCIVALTADGRVLAAGDTRFDKQVLAKWRNVVRICWFNEAIFGITDAGDVLYDNRDRYMETFCNTLKGIVKVVYYSTARFSQTKTDHVFVALRADGTVFTTGVCANTQDLTDIAALECYFAPSSDPQICAVTAGGKLQLKGTHFLPGAEDWQPFEHIDSHPLQRLQALQETLDQKQEKLRQTKGLFAGKQRKALQTDIEYLQAEISAQK